MGTQGFRQSLKHWVHAVICSGHCQSLLVWLIIVRNVSSLGSPEFTVLRNSSLPNGSGSLESLSLLAHGTHSFPVSIIYNSYTHLSTIFIHFLQFAQRKSFSALHCAQLSLCGAQFTLEAFQRKRFPLPEGLQQPLQIFLAVLDLAAEPPQRLGKAAHRRQTLHRQHCQYA